MELHHLRYFVIVAEEHSFTRAAERLNITQPPLSQQIRNLEDELGFPLFDRSKRQVELTPAGLLFHEKALKILAQVDQAVEGAKRISKGEPERLTIGFVNFAFYTTPLRLLQNFQRKFPQVELVLRELLSIEQEKALNNLEIDLGIALMPIKDDNLATEIITRDRFQALLPIDHRLAHEKTIRLEELANERFIIHPRNIKSEFYNKIIGLCQQAGFRPKIAQEVIQMNSVIKMVSARMGVALVPSCASNITSTGVVYKDLDRNMPDIGMGLVWRKDDYPPLLPEILKMIKELNEPGRPDFSENPQNSGLEYYSFPT